MKHTDFYNVPTNDFPVIFITERAAQNIRILSKLT